MKAHGRNWRNDSCGCAMGAKIMTLAFFGSALLYGVQFHRGQISGGGLAWRILLATFLGAGFGKLLGIVLYRMARHQAQRHSTL